MPARIADVTCLSWARIVAAAATVAMAAALLSPAAEVAPAMAQPAPGPGPGAQLQMGAHVVRPGESLFAIARRYQLPPTDLARLNGMRLSAVRLPGQSLRVPLGQAVNARADTPALASSGAASSTAAATASGPRSHTVQPGDTLYAISRTYGVAVDDLRQWNGLPADGLIRIGEVLTVGEIPTTDDATGGAPVPALPADEAPSPPSGARDETYVVQPGDTLTAIAARFGTTAIALGRLNDLPGDLLQAGQTLRVPRAGAGPAGASGDKRIEVDVSEQRMYVWQGDTLVWNFTVSTGLAGYPTRRGTFAVQSKVPNAWSSAWQLWMPHWLGIYWAGGSENGIHSLPIINGQRLWGGYLGSPISYGCIVLGINEAEQLYNWADMGTPVVVRD